MIQGGELAASADSQLPKDARQMGFDSRFADAQSLSDLVIAQALGDATHDLLFARAEASGGPLLRLGRRREGLASSSTIRASVSRRAQICPPCTIRTADLRSAPPASLPQIPRAPAFSALSIHSSSSPAPRKITQGRASLRRSSAQTARLLSIQASASTMSAELSPTRGESRPCLPFSPERASAGSEAMIRRSPSSNNRVIGQDGNSDRRCGRAL